MPGQALVNIGDKEWRAFLATTYYEITRGLGGQPSMPAGTGMLFVLGMDQMITVTTVPMLFPIDIVFISSLFLVNGLALNVAPGYLVSCEVPARYFLEVNAGEAGSIAEGDLVRISPLILRSQQGSSNILVNFAVQALALGLGVSAARKIIKSSIRKGSNDLSPTANPSRQKLLPHTGKQYPGNYEIKADRMGNLIITRNDDPGKDVFLQSESDRKLVYEMLRKGERKELDAGWPVRIKRGEPRVSILDELWESSAQPPNLPRTKPAGTLQGGTGKTDESGQPLPRHYRDLASFISEPSPGDGLDVLPAVVPGDGERKIDAVLKQLKDGVENLQDSQSFRLFLTTMSKFHDYSIGNLILIALQKPDATRVAGFHTWKDLGRWVKKGEKGISILAPVLPPRPTCPKCGAKVSRVARFCRECGAGVGELELEAAPAYFKVVHVFDVSQTEGKPLPEFEVPVLTGEASEELFNRAMSLAGSEGLSVSFESRPGLDPGLKGIYSGKSIWVRPEESRSQQLKTLLHEMAHYYAESVYRIPRADAEVLAESAAFVVGAHFGFDSGIRSFPYIALWSRDRKLLAANLDAIRKVSSSMIGSLEKLQAEERKQVEIPAKVISLKTRTQGQRTSGGLEFLADSCHHCQKSINGTGLRPRLEQAFQDAIARAKNKKGENI